MKKILVVDDDVNIRELLGARLKSCGYDVAEASNGVEAFAKLNDENPDLIILDVAMPFLDGYKFVQEIRWRDGLKDIPIVVLTARNRTKDMFSAIGISNFLTKPFDPEELLEMVGKNIQGKSKIQEGI